ncbi:hypothetical protein pb186bvf_018652 [Paramecium bursaria]
MVILQVLNKVFYLEKFEISVIYHHTKKSQSLQKIEKQPYQQVLYYVIQIKQYQLTKLQHINTHQLQLNKLYLV